MAFNTGKPIGSTDARDLSDNAQNFDEAINDRSNQTWTDRLGVARKTVWGAFSEITYKAPVAYASGISFMTTDANKTVEEAGVVYAPLNSALPFTTSGTFAGDDDDRFYPVQDKNNVIRVTSIADIEAYSVPAGYVFRLNSGGRSGTFDVVAGDFSSELAADTENGVYVGLSDNVSGSTKVAKRRYPDRTNFYWFGAVGDGANDTTSMQAAIDFGEPIYVSKGDFRADSLTVSSGINLLGNSKNSVISHSTVTVASNLFDMASNTGDVIVKGVKFNGRQADQPQSPINIRIFSSPENPNFTKCKFTDCEFVNIHTNAMFIQTNNLVRTKLDVINCNFENIYEDEDSNWNPSFCNFAENIDFYASGNSFKSGYSFSQDGAMAINHSSRNSASPVVEYARVRIIGNYFEGMGRKAPVSANPLGCIELRLWTEITVISNNSFYGSYGTSIRAKSDCKETVISGNSIRGGGGSGIEILRGVSSGPILGRASITGNIISTVAVNGISIFGNADDVGSEFVISSNVISNPGAIGIDTAYSDNIAITGNTVTNSTGIGIVAQNCKILTIVGNNTDATGGRSGIEAVNVENVIINSNHVNDADDVGIRVGGVTKAVVNGNIVAFRNNVSGNDVDYKLTDGTLLIHTGNVGPTLSTFEFSTSIINSNEST